MPHIVLCTIVRLVGSAGIIIPVGGSISVSVWFIEMNTVSILPICTAIIRNINVLLLYTLAGISFYFLSLWANYVTVIIVNIGVVNNRCISYDGYIALRRHVESVNAIITHVPVR